MCESAVLAAPRPVRNVVWRATLLRERVAGLFLYFDEPFVNTAGDVVFNATFVYESGRVESRDLPDIRGNSDPIVVSGNPYLASAPLHCMTHGI